MSPATKALSKKSAAKAAPAKLGKDQPAKCKPFSVSVTIVTSDDNREIHFGITKGCNADNSAFWTIDFTLKVKKGDQMKTRVEIHIVVGKDQDKEKAAALAEKIKKDKKLDDERVDLLQTDVADRALQIPAKEAQKDPVLQDLLIDVL